MKRDYTDGELRVLVINFLYRRRRWGESYFPLDTMVNWLGIVVRNNGKNVRQSVKALANEGHLLYHKKGETISLNPHMKAQIENLIANL